MEESNSFGQQMPSTAIPEGDTVPETRDEILTLDDVAAYLKAGKRMVHRLARKREIPACTLGGTWRFRRSELDRWLVASINRKPEAE